MTDAPNRKIGGLAPRAEGAPLARLMRSQRDAQAEPPAAEDAPAPIATTEAGGATTKKRPATPARRPTLTPVAEEPKDAITFRMPRSLRDRSRATFLATRTAEADTSYSDMLAKAIAAEVERREAAHNSGEPFTGGNAQLPAGRPFTA
ncbi:ParB family protein [Micromonospora sp. DT81.3]|uniref:ParB family protein n=1 Tax=Micromonospora sp. DT81.3 TaxID=3416523 RepID=UPI003CF60EDB